ncbi:MAG: hypothetical protein Q9221_008587 [Calogaya cf. arnoldii]
MADFVPPPGPPPPRVPEGWKAQWNDQYHEWFYVNLHTKISQWELPAQPAHPAASSDFPPSGAPPGYSGSGVTHHEKDPHSNNPYSASHAPGGGQNVESDAVLAAKLQAEEDERSRLAGGGRPVSRGAADQYYGQQQPQHSGYPGGPGIIGQQQQPPGYVGGYPGAPNPNESYDEHQLPPREQKGKGLGGLLSKLSGRASGGSSHGVGGGYPQQHGYGGGGYPQQHGYGGGGYGVPHKKPGMGPGGAMALGAGGGLLGGAMLGSAMGGHHGGYGGGYGGDDGGGYGGDDGGGYGGDDGGGYGGDDGGGDYGGGDFGGGDGGGGDGGGGD